MKVTESYGRRDSFEHRVCVAVTTLCLAMDWLKPAFWDAVDGEAIAYFPSREGFCRLVAEIITRTSLGKRLKNRHIEVYHTLNLLECDVCLTGSVVHFRPGLPCTDIPF